MTELLPRRTETVAAYSPIYTNDTIVEAHQLGGSSGGAGAGGSWDSSPSDSCASDSGSSSSDSGGSCGGGD